MGIQLAKKKDSEIRIPIVLMGVLFGLLTGCVSNEDTQPYKTSELVVMEAVDLGNPQSKLKTEQVATAGSVNRVNHLDPIPSPFQAFRGENFIRTKLSGDMSGKVLIFEVDSDDPFIQPWHFNKVKAVMSEAGVPPENLLRKIEVNGWWSNKPSTYWTNRVFNNRTDTNQKKDLKVVNLSWDETFAPPSTAQTIRRNNTVFVTIISNTSNVDAGPISSKRYLFSSKHPDWRRMDQFSWGFGRENHSTYRETLAAAETGKVLFVTWGDVDNNGEIVPYNYAVRCGDVKEACITVILPPYVGETYGTSFAAPIVSAAAFYLSQLWDDAEDVVRVLKDCAIDIGEPGIDEEFGVGALNLDCSTVRNKLVAR